eukprot:scaffold14151_cov103-Isochrysis_galbana.AAC.2
MHTVHCASSIPHNSRAYILHTAQQCDWRALKNVRLSNSTVRSVCSVRAATTAESRDTREREARRTHRQDNVFFKS